MTKSWVGRTMLNEEKEGWPHRRKNSKYGMTFQNSVQGKWNRKQLKRILYLTQASTGN